MTIARIVLLTAGCLVAAACGKTAQLQPARGQSLPVKPLLAKATPTAEQLLELPTNARPERVDELIKRSQPRQPDRFDLPPGAKLAGQIVAATIPVAAGVTVDSSGSASSRKNGKMNGCSFTEYPAAFIVFLT